MAGISPKPLGNTQIAATTSASSAALVADVGPKAFRVFNDGTTTAYIEFGGSSVAAATTGLALPGGAVEVITVKCTGKIYVSGIMASGTATVNVHPVDGGN